MSIPPSRKELEIPDGWGRVKGIRKIPAGGGGGGGMNGQISFQKVNFTFMPDIVNIASCSKCNEMWVQ